jgi:hypothetical protein
MSDQIIATPVAAPVVVDPKPVVTQAPSATETEKPHWLPARLERERQQVLKDLGVESVEDAKKAIAELTAKRDAEKTAAQKAAELETSLKASSARTQEMTEALNAFASSQLGSLTEEQRSAVLAVAGDDPAKQLKAVAALTPTWKAAAPPPAAKPADTAPAPAAPKDGGTPTAGMSDLKAKYEQLQKDNPIVAARYALTHKLFEK